MTCDDFVESIRKYRLLVSMEIMEESMRKREVEIAKFIKLNLKKQGIEIPQVLQDTIDES